MSDFGWFAGAQRFTSIGATTASTTGTSLTSPGSTNTKAAWTQLVASTAHDAAGMILEGHFTAPSGAGYGLADIAVGGSGSEVVLVADIPLMRLSSQQYGWAPIILPIAIAAGTRLSARFQASQASSSCVLLGQLVGKTFDYPILGAGCQSLGAVSATSKGTAVDPGGTANTKGSWVQMSASLAKNCNWVMMSVTQDSPITVGGSWLIDIGIGGSGSEVVVVPNIYLYGNAVGGLAVQRFFLPLSLVAGQRVAVRAQCASTVSTDRQLLVTMHLFG